MKAEEMIYHAANVAYNDGLRLASMHDLSGAIISLSRALKYNKRHTDARNLLGLVYYEYGEHVLALREWVISKNFQPEDNRADHYLKEVQRAGTLEKIDSVAKKFNLGLEYAKQGNLELARIQLKRVVSANPKMVRARLLLALVQMESGKYQDARKELRHAAKVDVNNVMIAEYTRIVDENIAVLEKNKKKRKKAQPDVIDITDGNDSWRVPRQTFVEAVDSTKSGVLNLLLGTGIGVLVAIFLIVPTVRQNANSDAANALINANAKAQSSKSDIEDLTAEVKTLKKKLSKYEGKADIKESYELLIAAKIAFDAEDLDGSRKNLENINKKLLKSKGKELYETISSEIQTEQMKLDYAEGIKARERGYYKNAIKLLGAVVKIDEFYEDGNAMFKLAESYDRSGNAKAALKYYNKIAATYPGRFIGRRSKERIRVLDVDDTEET